MKFHLSNKYMRVAYAVTAFVLGSVILLWSCNTLSMLFDGPSAQYKHALAALAIVYILGWVMRIAYRREHGRLPEGSSGAA